MTTDGSLTKGHGQKLTRHGERVLAALLQYSTVKAAADASGIGERTIFRWLQREDFQARFREAQRAVFSDAINELKAATSEAVQTLRRNLKSGNPFAENAAATFILAQTFKVIQMEEVQERLDAIERRLTEQDEREKRKWRA